MIKYAIKCRKTFFVWRRATLATGRFSASARVAARPRGASAWMSCAARHRTAHSSPSQDAASSTLVSQARVSGEQLKQAL